MEYPYYEFSVPLFKKLLGGLQAVLVKAESLPLLNSEGEAAVLQARLAPDMFPLVRQVQIACDNAKGAAARLAGIPVPKVPDTETSLQELQARIETTIHFLDSLTPVQFADAATVKVELPYFPDMHMHGDGYLKEYALPNFFFHVTTAYAIIRSLGGELGKPDFINGLPLHKNEV